MRNEISCTKDRNIPNPRSLSTSIIIVTVIIIIIIIIIIIS